VNVKVAITLLLVCSILIPLTIPQARTQSTTTTTNVQTLTSSVASTWISTIQRTSTVTQSIHFDVTPYYYNGERDSFTLSQFMIGSYDWLYCLYYDYFQLNITKGFEVRGHFETLNQMTPLNFYILNSDQLQRFSRSFCGSGSWAGDLHLYASSSDFDWIAPQSGEYTLLFLTPNWYNGPISFTVKGYVTTVQSSIVTYSTTQTYTSVTSRIIVSTLQGASPPPFSTFYYLPTLVAIIILGCIVSIVLLRKRHSTARG
jgi:hypothetical protein